MGAFSEDDVPDLIVFASRPPRVFALPLRTITPNELASQVS